VADEHDSPSGVALALVRALESEAELVDAGAFTFDLASARAKLAEYRLANPHAFVLLLVEAAHLLPGCSEIAFSIRPGETRVRLADASLRADEVRSLRDTIFVDLTTQDPEARRRELGRQRLALAMDAALAQSGASVELRATSDDPPAMVVLNCESTDQTVHEEASEGGGPLSLSLVFGRPRGLIDVGDEQRALLEARARYAKIPVLVEGQPINDTTPLQDVVEPVEIQTATGTLVGRAGWSSARAEPTAILLAHGVIVEEVHEPTWQLGFVALVDGDDLRRDLSLAKFVRDEAFTARVEAIRAVHDALPPNPALEVFYASLENEKWGLLIATAGMLVGTVVVGWFMAVLAVFFAGYFVHQHLGDVRRQSGHRAIGVIESVHVKDFPKGRKQLTLALRVHVADGVPFASTIVRVMSAGEAEQFLLARRVHLRVDPRDDRSVSFDSGPASG
jgi:hypothetical protein